MSLHAPMSRIPVRNRNDSAGHKRTISAPSKLEQMQIALQARIHRENFEKLARDKEERMLQVYADQQERNNKQILKYGYGNNKNNNNTVTRAQPGTNVGGVRNYFQSKRMGVSSAGKGVRGKPPLPAHHQQKNSAGRDRANPLAPLNHHRSPQLDYDDVGVLGQGGSPTGIRYSPKPQTKSKLAGRPQRRNYGTPNDSGNESSGYEDQNRSNGTYKVNKRRPSPRINQYQASSEEDVNTPPPKPTSFQQWKQSRGSAKRRMTDAKGPRTTVMHNGYNSDAPTSEFQKFQAMQDQEQEDRLQRYREKHPPDEEDFGSSLLVYTHDDLTSVQHNNPPNSNRSNPPPSTRLKSQPPNARYDVGDEGPPLSYRSNISKISAGTLERNAQLEAELKRKEQELLNMIQKQQRELESMKTQREKEEVQEQRESQLRAEQQERKQRAQLEEQERQRFAVSHAAPTQLPSPPPAAKPTVLRKARRVKPTPARKQAPPPAPPPPEESFFDTSNAAQFYADAAIDPGTVDVELDLVPCSLCGRRFAAERIDKHHVTCQKVKQASTKRKTFDISKMRTEGTEMAQYVNKDKPAPKKKDTGDWRKKREDFINSLRYARKVAAVEKQGGDLAELPPPPRTENAHYKQCPWCERRFAPDTAERHIPKCKEIKSRPAPVKHKRRGR